MVGQFFCGEQSALTPLQRGAQCWGSGKLHLAWLLLAPIMLSACSVPLGLSRPDAPAYELVMGVASVREDPHGTYYSRFMPGLSWGRYGSSNSVGLGFNAIYYAQCRDENAVARPLPPSGCRWRLPAALECTDGQGHINSYGINLVPQAGTTPEPDFIAQTGLGLQLFASPARNSASFGYVSQSQLVVPLDGKDYLVSNRYTTGDGTGNGIHCQIRGH